MRRKVRVSERRHILFIFTLMPVFLVTAFFGNSGGSHGLSTEQLEIVAASEDDPATRGKDRAAEPPDKPVSTVPAMTSAAPSSGRTETTTVTTTATTSATSTVISAEEKIRTADLTETTLSETGNEAVYEPEPEAEAVYESEPEAVYEPENVNEPEQEAVYGSEQITYEPEPEMSYLGNLKITGYTATGNLTASGVMPYVGGVAINSSFISDYGLSYGDTIYIDGLGYYTLNDTGCSYGVVDVFASTVDECYALTSYADVYLVN